MSQTSASTSTERHQLPVRTLVAASIGNAVEWFDWTIYATFAVYFSSQFFDKTQPDARADRDDEHLRARLLLPAAGRGAPRAPGRPARSQVRHARHDHADGGRLAASSPCCRRTRWSAGSPRSCCCSRASPRVSRWEARSPTPAPTSPRSPRRTVAGATRASSTSPRARRCSPRRCSACCSRPRCSRPELETYGWRIAFAVGGVLGLVGLYLRRTLVETEQFAENVDKRDGHQEPAAQDAHPLPAVGPAALRLHPALDAVLLHVLQRPDPVRGAVPRRRRERRVPRAVDRHGRVHRWAVPHRRCWPTGSGASPRC